MTDPFKAWRKERPSPMNAMELAAAASAYSAAWDTQQKTIDELREMVAELHKKWVSSAGETADLRAAANSLRDELDVVNARVRALEEALRKINDVHHKAPALGSAGAKTLEIISAVLGRDGK